MSDGVLIALISIVPTMTTIVTAFITNKKSRQIGEQHNLENRRGQAKNSIELLILQDKVDYALFGTFPVNKTRIYEEFDNYTKSYGNTYVHKVIDEYDNWINKIERSAQNAVQKG